MISVLTNKFLDAVWFGRKSERQFDQVGVPENISRTADVNNDSFCPHVEPRSMFWEVSGTDGAADEPYTEEE
jgi:hypothetical protein